VAASIRHGRIGDGGCGKNHPQATLEAATLRIPPEADLPAAEQPIKSKLTE